jgi:DNA topoisomerase 2-associated protein PAT1
MRKYEKELIAKIQISQLVTETPFVDDFYFQIYSLNKKSKEVESGKNKISSLEKTAIANQLVVKKIDHTNLTNQMQQQMKRLIDNRKAAKPREVTRIFLLNTVSLEGALGKISLNSTQRPKLAIQINTPSSSKAGFDSTSYSTLKVLGYVESVYDAILAFEDTKRELDKLDEEPNEEVLKKERGDLLRAMITAEQVPLR